MHALLPADDAGAPDEAGAEGGQPDGGAGLQPTRRARPGRSASGIEAEDVLATRSTLTTTLRRATPRRRAAASMIRGWPGGRRRGRGRRPSSSRGAAPRRRLDHPRDGVAVDLRPSMRSRRSSLVGVQQVGRARRRNPARSGRAPRSRSAAGDDDRARAVTEEHGRPAVGGVGDPRQRLGAADEDEPRAPALDQRGGLVERVEKAGAGGVDVDRRRRRRRRCASATSGASPGVSRSGVIVRDDDLVDLGGGAAGVGAARRRRPARPGRRGCRRR